MNAVPVIIIFDIGKTNKKCLVFDEHYSVLHEESIQVNELCDEDGFPCDDVAKITDWILKRFRALTDDPRFEVRALNFSGYGASFVYVDDGMIPVAPLYNYLKPYPEPLLERFYHRYNGRIDFSLETSSPPLASLNSGLQLYRFSIERRHLFNKTYYALHLPQYLSAIITRQGYSDITSIGCHTALWDFQKHDYHPWVQREGIISKLAPLCESDSCKVINVKSRHVCVGVGLHDSSAALIPYLNKLQDPFALISTGTWCITLNPFNHAPLNAEELEHDCLSYLHYQGRPVKASRLFAGFEHEQQVKRIADHYNVKSEFLSALPFDASFLNGRRADQICAEVPSFAERELKTYANATEAYHELVIDIVRRQFASANLVIKGTNVKQIVVDGGFSKNDIYMNVLALVFPEKEVYAASVPQASALGAAIAVHRHWNKLVLPSSLINLKKFSGPVFEV